MRKLLLALLLLVFAGAMTAPVRAQSGYGEITGIVTDPSGAVVSGASVVLSNVSTGVVRTAASNTSGAYRFTAVPIVGSWSLRVTAQGFAPFEATSLSVSVGAVTTQDVKLAVGGAKATVLVSGSSEPDVQTTTSSVSQLLSLIHI